MSPTFEEQESLRRYLRAVYPMAETLRYSDHSELKAIFDSLDYLYNCDAEWMGAFVPPIQCMNISSRTSPPSLPYVPPGIFYSLGPGAPHLTERIPKPPASIVRWLQPVEVFTSPQGPPIRMRSSMEGRFGPQPSWTPSSAIVRYVWWPVGFSRHEADESNSTISQTPDGHSYRPSRPLVASAHTLSAAQVRKRWAFARLQALRDGDWLEVQGHGGATWVRSCPYTCGLWLNVWRGTGVFMRVRSPFVSLSKATAIADMLIEVGRRRTARGESPWSGDDSNLANIGSHFAAFARTSRLNVSALRVLRRTYPEATEAEAVIMALYMLSMPSGPCPGKTFAPHSNVYFDTEWVKAARRLALSPRRVLYHLRLIEPQEYVGAFFAHWIHGICGIGARARASKQWDAAYDMLLAQLACMLGVHTLILGFSPNDNGLMHQEVIDYDLPQSSRVLLQIGFHAWPRIVPGTNHLNDKELCSPPFRKPKVRVQHKTAQEEKRRLEHLRLAAVERIVDHWDMECKFAFVDPLFRAEALRARGHDNRDPPVQCRTFRNHTNASKFLAFAGSMSHAALGQGFSLVHWVPNTRTP